MFFGGVLPKWCVLKLSKNEGRVTFMTGQLWLDGLGRPGYALRTIFSRKLLFFLFFLDADIDDGHLFESKSWVQFLFFPDISQPPPILFLFFYPETFLFFNSPSSPHFLCTTLCIGAVCNSRQLFLMLKNRKRLTKVLCNTSILKYIRRETDIF